MIEIIWALRILKGLKEDLLFLDPVGKTPSVKSVGNAIHQTKKKLVNRKSLTLRICFDKILEGLGFLGLVEARMHEYIKKFEF